MSATFITAPLPEPVPLTAAAAAELVATFDEGDLFGVMQATMRAAALPDISPVGLWNTMQMLAALAERAMEAMLAPPPATVPETVQ